ncbi:MAG: hypothetical protein QOH96_3864 [Blastocatellia bacterium]|jgi:hypothetical protein|nr:hypothetical protein [Blastocatellia bacterium]
MIAYRLIAFILTFTMGLLAALFAVNPAKRAETGNSWSHSCHHREFRRNPEPLSLPSGCFIKLDYGSDNDATIVYCNRGLSEDEAQSIRNYLENVNGPGGSDKFIVPSDLSTTKTATPGVILQR